LHSLVDPEISKGGGTKDSVSLYQPRRHLSQMHATNYMTFIWENAAYCKKSSEPIGRAAAPPPLNLPLVATSLGYVLNPALDTRRINSISKL